MPLCRKRSQKKKANGRIRTDNYHIEAWDSYDEIGPIERIERHFVDGMQYVYCRSKGLPVDETARMDAVKCFLSGRTKRLSRTA
ncbi:MAG: hypothetical protein ACYTAO_24385 [Planctomycetota bacterium]